VPRLKFVLAQYLPPEVNADIEMVSCRELA
jgi:hypothetical protein